VLARGEEDTVTQVYSTWISTEKLHKANKDVEKSILLTYTLRVLCAYLAFFAVKTNHVVISRRNNHRISHNSSCSLPLLNTVLARVFAPKTVTQVVNETKPNNYNRGIITEFIRNTLSQRCYTSCAGFLNAFALDYNLKALAVSLTLRDIGKHLLNVVVVFNFIQHFFDIRQLFFGELNR
jgi:hypothetical protein